MQAKSPLFFTTYKLTIAYFMADMVQYTYKHL